MKKTLLFFAFFSSLFAFSQIGTNIPSAKIGSEDSKWTFGGYAGLGGAFGGGNSGTALYIMPRVGYKVTENFEAGLAGNVTWNNSRYFSSTMVGVGPFANYYFSRSFYVSGLYQHFFVNQRNKATDQKYTGNEDALYLGGGYMQKIGDRVYMQIGLMYNVLYDDQTSVFGGGLVPNIGIVYGL